MTVLTNASPYFDDFDENKNFVRVLFKPGVAVQARELTQSQAILQNQIKSVGNFLFKDGSIKKYLIEAIRLKNKLKKQITSLREKPAIDENFILMSFKQMNIS